MIQNDKAPESTILVEDEKGPAVEEQDFSRPTHLNQGSPFRLLANSPARPRFSQWRHCSRRGNVGRNYSSQKLKGPEAGQESSARRRLSTARGSGNRCGAAHHC